MRYLIDGYNLAHALGVLSGPVNPAGLRRSRLQLLTLIAEAHGNASTDVTVVFDARAARALKPDPPVAGIDVRYAVGEEADDVIERLVRQHPARKKLAVVSDDRRVLAAARRRGCEALGCQEYLDRTERRAAAPAPPAGPEKPDSVTPAEAAEWEARFSAGPHRWRN